MPLKFTPDIIAAAIEGFEAQKRGIDEQIAELRAMVTGQPPTVAAKQIATSVEQRFSAATRRKMALAQKARWARLRGEAAPQAIDGPEKPKRKLSDEGRKRIIAATKKRWRLQKAAQEAKESTVVKRPKAKSQRALQAPGQQE